MNVVLLVVDSLRAASLGPGAGTRTPFLDRLARESVAFRRAHATECWTLPTHLSMFTGLLPSQHGAHFQGMAYRGAGPTVAETLRRAGHHTEVVTRNSLFDGSIPGATRGFEHAASMLAPLRGAAGLLGILLAVAKPRVRRLLRESGFVNALQRERRDFVATMARMGMPADRPLLSRALERMGELRRRGRPYFLFLNLFDVHMPYSPSDASPLRPVRSFADLRENLSLPLLLPKVSSHAYLRPGFRMSERGRDVLLARYHRAIELMDRKLEEFHEAASSHGLLDETLLVVTSDHGEAFGEHGLFFHDASVWQTHLHVPLWIIHPRCRPRVVDETVSTRDLFSLMRAVGLGHGVEGTLLDEEVPRRRPVALAEHFHYPRSEGLLPQFGQNLAAAVVGRHKAILRRDGLWQVDLDTDPAERSLRASTVADFVLACRRDGAPAAAAEEAAVHLRRWEAQRAAA